MKRVGVILLSVFIIFICLSQEAISAPPMALGDADIVPYKQWEFWLSFNYREMKEKKVYKTPTLEIIYGIVPRLEVGVEATYIVEDENGNKTEGIDCIAIQPKFLLMEEKESIPAIAAGLLFEVPTDEEKNQLDWSESKWAPSLTIQKHFGKILSIAQIKYFIDEKWKYGIDIMYGLDKNLKLLAEVYAENFINSEKKDELNFRMGLKYKFMENAKVYFAAGRSLLTARANRPLFEANGGVMIEF